MVLTRQIIYCECGCQEQIPLINKLGQIARFRRGHNSKGRNHPMWKGGRVKVRGYWYIRRPYHKFATKRGYILESRYFKELELGHYIDSKYDVHHIDGDTENNDWSNLEVVERHEHRALHQRVDMSNRICWICNTRETDFDTLRGYAIWHKFGDDFLCNKCNQRIYKKNKEVSVC